jgi:hypothetical protein
MSYYVDNHAMFSYDASLPAMDNFGEDFINVKLLRDFDQNFPPRKFLTEYTGHFLAGETFTRIEISFDYPEHIMYIFYREHEEITTIIFEYSEK